MLGAVGDSIPPGDPHGVSVSLPTWQDTVGWSSRDPRILNLMKTGYPRFFIPRIVDELAEKALVVFHSQSTKSSLAEAVKNGTRKGLVLQTLAFANLCEEFLIRKGVLTTDVFVFSISVDGILNSKAYGCCNDKPHDPQFHIVSYPAEHFKLAKAFWQHTGYGISSRCAEYWLQTLDFSNQCKGLRNHNLPFCEAESCHTILCERIAGLASTNDISVTNHDVFLYPTGMSAISHTASALISIAKNQPCKVAIFGFLYVDTFKVLTTVHNLIYTLYGHATPTEITTLETSLANGDSFSALYLEFPGNPLLTSPDLTRLQTLSQKYSFTLIVDDTVGTTVNLSLLSHSDILATSLTKMFSGACNVMGGSLTLNPRSPSYHAFHKSLTTLHPPKNAHTYFPLDLIILEQNSRSFANRVALASTNALLLTRLLRSSPIVSQVHYPESSTTQAIYDTFRRPGAGYGFLLSIIFHRPQCAVAFYDALDVAKGPSLGTEFTLACAYTLLAHYSELEWARTFGVDEFLVRISVGVEDWGVLEAVVGRALEAAVVVDRGLAEEEGESVV